MNNNANGNLSFLALEYVHAWERHRSLDGEIAFKTKLRAVQLDFSVESLRHIDRFLDEIREQHRLTETSVVRYRPLRALFCWLAFYVGEVIGRSVQTEPQWFSFDAYNELFDGDASDRCFETSMVLGFPDNPRVKVPFFKPLISIVARATNPDDEKSVWFSAGLQIPPAVLTSEFAKRPQSREF
ncbi:MAG: hypothetical protein C4K60_16250 [Ideonella sp. MAG2]|nr:MAG: hypothetical protein C4K60_16250 [Ideonella sp. MAG2]